MAPPEVPEIDVLVRDGDTVSVENREFHVLHTPGHTQGSIGTDNELKPPRCD